MHLCYASTGGEQGRTSLRSAMRAVAERAIDTTGPSDAADRVFAFERAPAQPAAPEIVLP